MQIRRSIQGTQGVVPRAVVLRRAGSRRCSSSPRTALTPPWVSLSPLSSILRLIRLVRSRGLPSPVRTVSTTPRHESLSLPCSVPGSRPIARILGTLSSTHRRLSSAAPPSLVAARPPLHGRSPPPLPLDLVGPAPSRNHLPTSLRLSVPSLLPRLRAFPRLPRWCFSQGLREAPPPLRRCPLNPTLPRWPCSGAGPQTNRGGPTRVSQP